jgi:alpha-beta hydrolase superfamily lysophospholipase
MVAKKLLLRSCCATAILYVVVSIIAGIFAVEFSLHPPRKPLRYAKLAQALAARNQAALANIEIVAGDGARLRAWFATPTQGNNNVVLLFHGVSDNREGMGGFGQMFLRRGYSVLLMDSRAHGESGGAIASYGLREAADVHEWVEWLERTAHPYCVFALGESMGAATLLQSLRTEPRFCAVAAESPFQNFREIAFDRAAQVTRTGSLMARTLGRPAIEVGLIYAKLRYGLDLTQISPEDAVAASKVPVLLIHGGNDANIPPRHSVAIKARNPNLVSLWIVPGAVHTAASSAAPAEFEQRVLQWFGQAGTAKAPVFHN